MKRRGFTVIELVFVLAGVVILVVVGFVGLGIMMPAMGTAKATARQLVDATQIRGIGQAFTIWAGNNDDMYPLPSKIDLKDATVADVGRAKDTTGNIMSMLVNDGSIIADMLVSPAESNSKISAYTMYEVEQPTGAVDPNNALWDPKLTGDFTRTAGGHISYAHLIPVGERLKMWSPTYKASEAVLGNRGPQVASTTRNGANTTTAFANPTSNTLLIHASGTGGWSGNIAYNDNHVDFHSDLYTHNANVGATSLHNPLTDTAEDGTVTQHHDVLFHDEEGYDSNLFLGIFNAAGETEAEYNAIWD